MSLICNWCGFKNSNESNKCENCGTELNRKETEIQNPKENKTESRNKLKFKISNIFILLSFITAIILYFNSPENEIISKNIESPKTDENNSAEIFKDEHEIHILEEEINKNPNNFEAILKFANKLHDAKFFDRAKLFYQKYLDANPKNVDARVDYGICFYETKEPEKAIQIFKDGLKYNPKHQKAMFNIGIINLSLGNMEESKLWFKKSIEANPISEFSQKVKLMLEKQ
ncbi:MAG: tetratricopeptide repeat protein [Bacteroidetes bacterium]|nr:tetratricopeptide repeat protein [Bacteroidota bacterium]